MAKKQIYFISLQIKAHWSDFFYWDSHTVSVSLLLLSFDSKSLSTEASPLCSVVLEQLNPHIVEVLAYILSDITQ
jgi:hypothetical protein